MEESWENELRKYWCIIANETEALLKRECIKNHVQFNDGFKNDLLQTTNKRYDDLISVCEFYPSSTFIKKHFIF